MGAGDALELAVRYAKILFAGIGFVFFQQSAISILRSEGDVKRAMYAMVGGAVLNMVLDPIFIYTLGLGVAGAAWATILSMFLVSALTGYWLFVERKTYVSFRFKGFRFHGEHVWDITRVGFPASVSQMSMAIMAFAVTTIVATVGGPDGVAVYTTGWRIIALAALPVLGVATAVTSVSGAAYGAREFEKIEVAYSYALKVCVAVESVFALLMVLFASPITWVFTWSADSDRIVNDLIVCLRILWVLLPAAAFGMLSAAMFQGVGKGLYALITTLLRTLVLNVPLAWVFGVQLGLGLRGVWIGMAIAGLTTVPIAFGWAMVHIRWLERNADVPIRG
jgi:putative MATE family efflux protein